ncbi:ABC efflux pump, inner membrane subunit [Candidatus Koribacter versatilis Ellin345]|uniref:ABC efflux pump, inner membrane subunit n=1 Tax=Koribacter versatilis (strain Ellin345) TaxID=204669 RepID=Q1IVJ4_KORVE|nr:ABC transporter permease [Candidatus Koribacter versatilis]ABF39106.1 ABC efflux pump, inner membrane subunit [Candidatus Koribacter versatilis Ellin345]
MHGLLQELRFALRQIRKSPGFSLAVVLTMAIGIGMSTAMFTVMDAVVLRPLAVPDMERVASVSEESTDHIARADAMGNVQDWYTQSHSFSEMAWHRPVAMNMTGAGDPEQLMATLSSANLFDLLRVKPWLGRTFAKGEDEPGADRVAVLSYSLWQKQFGEDRNAVGRKIQLDGKEYDVIGVMPQGFRYASYSDIFIPLGLTPAEKADRAGHLYSVLARLNPGVTREAALAELSAIAAHDAKEHPETNLGWGLKLRTLADSVNDDYTPMYMRLMLGVGIFVLLIICANVSNLQFARSIGRRTEIAIRSAMGAGRTRIVRQLLIESTLLCVTGALAGILVARLQLHLTLITMPPRVARFLPGWSNINLNGRALAYSLGLAVFAGIFSGLAPSLSALRLGVAEQLKAGGRTVAGDRRSHALRNIFAVAQITLAVALVAGAALMGSGMRAMLRQTDRYSPKTLLTFEVNLPHARYATAAQQKAFYDESLQALRNTPGVASADITPTFPVNNTGVWWQDVNLEHVQAVPGESRATQRLTISPSFLSAMHVSLLEGRWLNDSDGTSTTPVAVISKKFADRYFEGKDPIGRRMQLGKPSEATPWITVVGVAEDITWLWVDKTPQPTVYLSYAQFPGDKTYFAVRANGDADSIAPAVRRAFAQIDATLPLSDVQSYDVYLHETLVGLEYVVGMFVIDALVALLLAAIGIFGVMANSVSERTHEIGVRMAMGAQPKQIRILVLRRAAVLTIVGLALGIPMAGGLARMMANLIFGVSAGDLRVFVGTAGAVTLVALLATLLPAHRATSVQPMTALRNE